MQAITPKQTLAPTQTLSSSETVQRPPMASFLRGYATMSARIGRRLLPCLVVLTAFLVIRSIQNNAEAKLRNEAFASGYSLVATTFLLLLLGVRKRITTPRFGSAAIWQCTHHYLGMFCLGAYVLHAGVITTGWLESMLAISFWAITLSGLVSWYINRTAPRLLSAAGPQILRQDIAERKKQVASQAYRIAIEAAGRADSATLADHYQSTLIAFFGFHRGLLFRIRPTGSHRRRMLAALENLDRYLDDQGKVLRRQMSSLVQAKDDLDFQSAIQNRIRLWASIHTWLLGGFVILTIAHVWVAYQFSSRW